MYYRLKDNFLLRGWDLLPFALHDTKTHSVNFFDKHTFSIMGLCDGEHFIDVNKLTSDQLRLLNDLISKDIVEKCDHVFPLNDGQKYIKFPCRYMASAHWSITGKCNYKCRHCFMSATDVNACELSLADIKKIIKELAECGIYNVSLTGGEPLVRDDFLEILDALMDAHINVDGVYTNGKLLNEELLDAFEVRNMHPIIHMSYDGKGWHDWIRGIPGAEKYAIDAFALCKERGFETTAEMCIHKKNKDTFCETVDKLADLNCISLKINAADEIGNWEKSSMEYSLSVKEEFDVYLEYIKQFFENGMKISLQLGSFFICRKGSTKYELPLINHDSKIHYLKRVLCKSVRNTLYISPEGIALPCMPLVGTELKNNYPSILDNKLCNILSDSYYMKTIDTRLKEYFDCNPECDKCEHKGVCDGGCRAEAAIHNSDYMAKDLRACFFFKNNYKEKIEMVVDSVLKNQS